MLLELKGFIVRRAIVLALITNIVASLVLLPIAGNPFDLSAIIGTSNAYMSWGVSPWLHWKFGGAYAVYDLMAAGGSRVLVHLGLQEASAALVAFKGPLILANVASGYLILRIMGRLRPELARRSAVTWFLNPVTVGVAGLIGQVEPITVLCILGAVYALLDGRRWVAVVFIAVGTGFEFVPFLALGVPVLVRRGGNRSDFRRTIVTIVVGSLLSLLNFAPLLVSETYRLSFVRDLIGNTSGQVQLGVKNGTVWKLFGPVGAGLAGHWVLLSVVLVLVLFVFAGYKLRGAGEEVRWAGAIGWLGVSLVVLPVMDPASNPQFYLLVLCGLYLISAFTDLGVVVLAVAPAMRLVGTIVGGSLYQYFESAFREALSAGNALLPVIANAGFADEILSDVATVMVVVVAAVFVVDMFGGSRLHSGVGVGGRIGLVRFGGVALAFSVTVLLVVVGVQPRLWSTVLSRRGGSGLFDVPYLVSRRVDILSRVVGGVVYGSVDHHAQCPPAPPHVMTYRLKHQNP